jgi:creatinine amidohydrolase/Fe(II)-dependent formamide hydrolase-like protein
LAYDTSVESLAREAPRNFRALDELTGSEINALDRDRALAVCAVSALEVHGPHLPLGSDLHQACWLADETGRRFAASHPDWLVVRHPPLALGTDELPLPGSINSQPRTVYRAVRALGDSLARAGFRYVMLTNAHGGPRHAAALESACRAVSRRHGIAMFTPAIRALHRMVSGQTLAEVEALIGRPLAENERHGLVSGEHAGTWETSWYLAQRPELVAPEYKALAEDHPPKLAFVVAAGESLGALLQRLGLASGKFPVKELLASLAGSLGWLANARFGWGRDGARVSYSGWPAVASPEVGRAYAELPVRMCLEDLEAVVAGRLHPRDVRSIASDPALIQPWFPRVALAIALALAAIAALALAS